MVKVFIFPMGNHIMTNKGFSLLSTLLSLMIISSLTLLSLARYKEIDVSHFLFLNELLDKQSLALTSKQQQFINDSDLYFNSKGHVNKAETITFSNHDVIVHLGNGYATYK